jgi:hypothetical protein
VALCFCCPENFTAPNTDCPAVMFRFADSAPMNPNIDHSLPHAPLCVASNYSPVLNGLLTKAQARSQMIFQLSQTIPTSASVDPGSQFEKRRK